MPSRLAMYIAASASRISSSASRAGRRLEHRDADAAAQTSSLCVDAHRLGERLEDPLGGVGGLLAPRRPRAGRRTRRRRSAPRCRRADAARRAAGDLDEHLVAGRVAEAVVDGLEVVEVEEEHRQAAPLAPARATRGAPLGEQRAVGEAGDRVVERLVGELLLERLALADVAALSTMPPTCSSSSRFVSRISNWRAAVAVAQRALERLGAARRSAVGDELREAVAVAGIERARRSACRRARRACSRARARSTGSGRRSWPSASSTVMRSLACWTSEPKRASLRRRWTSSLSAALSSASATWSPARAARLDLAGRRRPAGATSSGLRARASGETAWTRERAPSRQPGPARARQRAGPRGGGAGDRHARRPRAAPSGRGRADARRARRRLTATANASARARGQPTSSISSRLGRGDELGAGALRSARARASAPAGARARPCGDDEPEQDDRRRDDDDQVESPRAGCRARS